MDFNIADEVSASKSGKATVIEINKDELIKDEDFASLFQ